MGERTSPGDSGGSSPPEERPEGPESLVEVRLLDGPNLYFPRPAAKITLNCAGLVDLPVEPRLVLLRGFHPRPACREFLKPLR